MSITRKRFRAVIALVVAIAITPAMAGCFGNPLETILEGATGGDVDLGGSSVPDGFPSEVPLIDGEVLFGAAIGDDSGKVFNVTIKVSDSSAIETIKSELEAAGFEESADIGGTSADGATAVYSSDSWGVLVVVTRDGNNGFVANYTVTSADSN